MTSEPRGTVEPGGWKLAARMGVRYWAVALAAYLLITLCAFQLGDRPRTYAELFMSWRQWDAWWYIAAATDGYPTADVPGPPPPEARYAFFPLFPLLIRIIDVIAPGNAAVAAFLVSILTFLGLLVVFYRFLDSEVADRATVDRTVWYLLLFPTAFFLAAPYPMALFLMLVIGSIYFMRQGRWWAAGLVGALATASRASALLLVGIFVLEYLRQREWSVRRIRADAAWVALIPVGLLSYLAFAAVRIGNPLAPFDAQDYWEHRLDWPWTGVLRVARYVAGNMGPDFTLFPVVDLALVTLMAVLLVLAVYGPYRLRPDQWPLVVFGLGALWFAISFPMPDVDPIKSASRYMLEVFAGFMVLGRMGAARWFDRVYVALALPLQTLLLVIHLHTGWVA